MKPPKQLEWKKDVRIWIVAIGSFTLLWLLLSGA